MAERVGVEPSVWLPEHRSRYRLAVPLLSGGTVLDVACGSGLGLDILTSAGCRVVGVDASEATVGAAAAANRSTPLCVGSADDLPFPDGCFDGVTSFETIEHVTRPERMVAELVRVLRPGGVLVLSTPNARFTRPRAGRPRNPWHVQEFEPEQLRGLLATGLEDLELLGQGTTAAYGRFGLLSVPLDRANRHPGVVAWKLAYRLPPSLRERLSRTVRGRSFFPGEDDYCFESSSTTSSHCTVAIGHKPPSS